MIDKDKLKEYAAKLMFDMKEEEYETLEQEFDIILKQMDKLEEIENIHDVEPMTFPFVTYKRELREDKVENTLTKEELFVNVKDSYNDRVKVPKVVE